MNIATKYGIDIVAFSSPLNKQISTSCLAKTSTKYYSGYAEDSVLGSCGSFFDLKPDFLNGFPAHHCTIEVNPPFIERILLDTVRAIEKFFKYAMSMLYSPKLTVLFVTPDWTDAEYFRAVNELTDCKVHTVKLFAGDYSYENATEGTAITSKQNSWLFVITNWDIPKEDLSTILTGFKVVDGAPKHLAKYGGRGVRRK